MHFGDHPGGAGMALLLLLLLLAPPIGVVTEQVRELEISESVPAGTRIGYISDGGPSSPGPPYLIVPVPGSAVDSDLSIEHTTGEIRTKVRLDRETRGSYSLVAIPLNGDNIRVVVRVLDENDNAPKFPSATMDIEFPENTPRDVKRTLNPARDPDLGVFNTQRYNIVSGNVNNAFRLSSHRERDGVLYLDLQINGFLDRETTSSYTLEIEALDGGSPPLRGVMTVNITIQDVNDNQPIFNQSRYHATVPENATVGTSVLRVSATDSDAGDNGQIEYSINRRQSDRDNMFRIDAITGMVVVNKPLDFETKELHELVVVARDHGLQPLETTAFVSIRVTDVNDNQPTINVIFLSDDATPKISESAQPGEFVARISVNDPDSKTEYSNINVTLSGGDGRFGLTTRDNIIYLVIVSLPLDRESQPDYTLNVVATDTGSPPLHASRTIHLKVTDINDNAPAFETSMYHADVMEAAKIGASVIKVTAIDKDEGDNSELVYSLQDSDDSRGWFTIDAKTGVISTSSRIDCEVSPEPRLTVLARDGGRPPLSSTAIVLVTVHDVNDNEPVFEKSFYNISVPENEPKGRCVLTVTATDPDCGVNAIVNYTLLNDGSNNDQREFRLDSASGRLCIAAELDYEMRSYYEFAAVATDRGGLSTTSIITIHITDINDNRPTFQSLQYQTTIRETQSPGSLGTILTAKAKDADGGLFGTITYTMSPPTASQFRVDPKTGDVTASVALSPKRYVFNVSAIDGAGLRSPKEATVVIVVLSATTQVAVFEKPRYEFKVKEDLAEGTVIGKIKAQGSPSPRYSLSSTDGVNWFTLDSNTGALSARRGLDREHRDLVILTAHTSGQTQNQAYAQIIIKIEDINDNPPRFPHTTVRISVPENAPVSPNTPFYVAKALDVDLGLPPRYRLASTGPFRVDPQRGYVTLTQPLDYEMTQRYAVVVTATDGATSELAANLTLLVEVQDVNDNAPVFERAEYSVRVAESAGVDTQLLQVTAVDLDTGNNARLTYRLASVDGVAISEHDATTSLFGVRSQDGWFYVRGALDREAKDRYELSVIATDGGAHVALTATTKVSVIVTDVNDNDPRFSRDSYEFTIEENQRRGSVVGSIHAVDPDVDQNAALRYSLIPANTSFQIHPTTGEISTREVLDREQRATHELIAEARDRGTPARWVRVALRIHVADVNDNAPEIVDPRGDALSVREGRPVGSEVARLRAVDRDRGDNATVVYSLEDSEGASAFTLDPFSGVLRTRAVLVREERAIYRLAIAAVDRGRPPRRSVRLLNVEVLEIDDDRPTFTSSSLVFKIREDVPVGYVVGSIGATDSPLSNDDNDNSMSDGGRVTYTLTSLTSTEDGAFFDIDRVSGSLVVARPLDRETSNEHRLEVKALMDSSSGGHAQSVAVSVQIEILDANDNPPTWTTDPLTITLAENVEVGTSVFNYTASDSDAGANNVLRYKLTQQYPSVAFNVDPLTGALTLIKPLDYESLTEYTIVVEATDQSVNVSERLTTAVTTRVLVSDINDNAPFFVWPTSDSVTVHDIGTAGSELCKVVAFDKDSGDNGRLTYEISGGDMPDRFVIDAATGVLKRADSGVLPSEARVKLVASDNGSPKRQTDEFLLTVRFITDDGGMNRRHGGPPRFSEAVHRANLSEDSPSGSFVARVTAKAGVSNQTISYSIPRGSANDQFTIDAQRGTVTTTSALDREIQQLHIVPIYAMSPDSSGYDVTTLLVTVIDANDHAPRFAKGACRPLAVPENSDFSPVRTIAAIDEDAGSNSLITYSITAGNSGNKFSIDPHTGVLSARPLDRESQARYQLLITAQDRGSPVPLQGTCNVSVSVQDQNDSDPEFESQRYTARLREDAPKGTVVLTVRATDADSGVNARIVYSLANESQWLFNVDERTGVITTTGSFDREIQGEYSFLVVATDGGRYDARSARVPVTITLEDVNDNRPHFSAYPFNAQVNALTQPGQTLLRITATDSDIGTNAEVVYSLDENTPAKFRLDPNTGALTSSQSLASEAGRLLHLHVIARDKGNPPLFVKGLIQLRIGEEPSGSPNLRFLNATYSASLLETSPVGSEVARVAAVRSDGRRQRIIYGFGAGNEDNAFNIDADSGVITVRDSEVLNYEQKKEIIVNIIAHTEAPSALYGFSVLRVNLEDKNDNVPRFSQHQYSSAVWEGNNKGTFVTQLSAFDLDEGVNARLSYHIVDGNHDDAFAIEPPFSGLLKTNIVLDREIRDAYTLTVIAVDGGSPQMTGTATVKIGIVDVNDNQPTFPPQSAVEIPEDLEVGSLLTTLTANDVDTNPALTYALDCAKSDLTKSSCEDSPIFGVDRFSGAVSLLRPLDYEMRQIYSLTVSVSDSAHSASTKLTVKVTDVNDNAPQFQRPAYRASLISGLDESSSSNNKETEILTVNATDADSELNGKIQYSLLRLTPGFRIDEETGSIYANRSTIGASTSNRSIRLAIVAQDKGTPELSSVAAVLVQIPAAQTNSQSEMRVTVAENVAPGSEIATLKNGPYRLTDTSDLFAVTELGDKVIVIGDLDREARAEYEVQLTSLNNEDNQMTLHVDVSDINDNSPQFERREYEAVISESAIIGTFVFKIIANDSDSPGLNSHVTYSLLSGDDSHLFSANASTGVISVHGHLDYDIVNANSKQEGAEYFLVLRACDAGKPQLCSLTTLHIKLKDENDNTPKFPVAEYLEFVAENEPAGTPVFRARANDADRGRFGTLEYSISSASDVDESRTLFRVDSRSGQVTTTGPLDYELRHRYAFTLRAVDLGGRSATVRVRILVDSRDEFAPQFTQRSYRFSVSASRVAVGEVVGRVTATDRDKGADGRVVYQLAAQHACFKINRTTGEVLIKRKLHDVTLPDDVNLVVTASSGRRGSLTDTAVVEITLDPSATGTNMASHGGENGLADWIIGLLIALVTLGLAFGAVLLFLHMRGRRSKHAGLNSKTGLDPGDDYADPGTFDTMRNVTGGVSSASGQFAPPKYDEIPPYATASDQAAVAVSSELSGSEQSGSSGRGSAEEEGEDEEIRMINEGTPDADALSDVSVHNTQEYLARLGIVESAPAGPGSASSIGKESALRMFDDEPHATEPDIANLIYAKLNEVTGTSEDGYAERGPASVRDQGPSMNGSLSSIVHSEEELTGSYNWDYLLDWGPQYQPLAHVFSEIARLKDDTASVHSGSSAKSKTPSQCKTVPPPLLTAVAPRTVPVALLSGNRQATQFHMPRSPISHDASGGFCTSSAMSPSFSPSLSPLAGTRSPSISPLVTPGLPTSHHVVSLPRQAPRKAVLDTELRI